MNLTAHVCTKMRRHRNHGGHHCQLASGLLLHSPLLICVSIASLLFPCMLQAAAAAAGGGGAGGTGLCTKHVPVGRWDTCTSLTTSNQLAPTTLVHLNPGLDCAHLPGRVCVRGAGDLPPECGKYDEVKADKHGHAADTCVSLAVRNDMQSLEHLEHLNPGLDCGALKAGQLLCVQEHHQAKAESRCIDWEEIVGDGITDPCSVFPPEINPQVTCDGGPIPEGARVRGCKAVVKVDRKQGYCTRYKAFTSDGQTNYCLIKGGLEAKEALIRHLQLNDHLYCGKGAEGRNVVVCMEGDIMDPLEDTNAPGSYTRDHILLRLLDKLQHSPNLPKPGSTNSQNDKPFQRGTQGHLGTDAHYIRTARKLPHSFMEDAANLVHMATVGVQQYKHSGNQLLAHAAWGALMKAIAVADFSSDLSELQQQSTEFDEFIGRMLVHQKRDAMCKTITPAATRRPQLLPVADCFCDPEQHVLRCEMMMAQASAVIKKQESGHAEDMDEPPVTEMQDAIVLPAAFSQSKAADNDSDFASGDMWSIQDEAQAYRNAGADPSLGVMDAAATEAYHMANSSALSMGSRLLLQKGTVSQSVIDSNLLKLTNALIDAKNEVCKKVKGSMDDMVEKLQEFAATCTVKYDKGADFCGGEKTCLSIGCPAVDLQLVNIYLTGTLCVALPRDNWVRCRAACMAMQLGYNKLGERTELNCPEACIRFIGDGWVTQSLELGISVCLGGNAFNAIKWADALVPDFVENLFGINWKDLLCVELFRAKLSYTTGLLQILVNWSLKIVKVNFDISFQLYRPVNYPEVCDCNVSPWACEKFCRKRPGGVSFTGALTIGVRVGLPWPIPDFNLQHVERFNAGLPDCKCGQASTSPTNDLCKAPKGVVPSSSTCSACPAGFVTPNGAACMICPAGSIPNTAKDNCVLCAVDYVAPSAGTTACVKCGPPLKSSKAGGKVCTGRCPAGTGFDKASQSCKECRPGEYNPGTKDNAVCKKCPKGTYASKSHASACEPCPPGTAAVDEGSKVCSRCKGGYIPADCTCPFYGFVRSDARKVVDLLRLSLVKGSKLQKTVLDKPLDSFAASICWGQTACKSCEACRSGSYSKPGDVTCTKCPPGFWQPVFRESSCVPCPAGQATAEGQTGAFFCNTCPAGTFTDGCRPLYVMSLKQFKLKKIPVAGVDFQSRIKDSTFAKDLRAAGLKPITGKRLLAAGAAPEGFVFTAPATVSELKGQFVTEQIHKVGKKNRRASPLQGALGGTVFKSPFAFNLLSSRQLRPTALGCSRCKKCDPGTYTTKPGQAICSICPAGYYQPRAGASTCLECGVGRISAYPGSTSCQKCKFGSYSFCNGTRSAFEEQSTRIAKCSKGLTGSACAACPGVTYNKKTKKVAVNLTKLPKKYLFPPGCPAWCQPGFFGKKGWTPCKPCPPGKYAPTPGTKACSTCPVGSFTEPSKAATKCTLCTKATAARGGVACSKVVRLPTNITPIKTKPKTPITISKTPLPKTPLKP